VASTPATELRTLEENQNLVPAMVLRQLAKVLVSLVTIANAAALYNVSRLATSANVKFNLSVPIALVSMVKNEEAILGLWIEYNASLCDISKIVVLDNYSTDVKTHSVLEHYGKRGSHVR
jgi:hypothetical protein